MASCPHATSAELWDAAGEAGLEVSHSKGKFPTDLQEVGNKILLKEDCIKHDGCPFKTLAKL